MAYDPNDPKDKATVQALIDAAVEEANEAHETATEGLRNKVTELRGKLTKARKEGGSEGGADVERLESELEAARTELSAAKRDLNKANKSVETLTGERDGLNKNLEGVLINQGLTTALSEAKVDAKFLPAVTAMLSPKVSLKLEGNDRKAVVGDKSLGDFIKEWSQGDEGKAYVTAAGNSGGGAGGPQGGNQNNGKTWTRAQYDAADAGSRSAFFADGGSLTD